MKELHTHFQVFYNGLTKKYSTTSTLFPRGRSTYNHTFYLLSWVFLTGFSQQPPSNYGHWIKMSFQSMHLSIAIFLCHDQLITCLLSLSDYSHTLDYGQWVGKYHFHFTSTTSSLIAYFFFATKFWLRSWT